MRLAISFHADAQHNYVVEYRNDLQPLAPCDAWRPVAFAPHNYGIVFLTNQITTPSRLYRLRRIEQPFAGLHALLLDDTGSDPLDGLTSDPTVSGLVVPSQLGLELQASLDAPDGPFATLLPLPRRQHFLLERDRLDLVAGGLLEDGDHVLHLRTATAAGEPVNTFAVPFHLDTTPPQILLETDPPLGGVGLGEGATTREKIALLARTEPGLSVELAGTPWTGVAGDDGWIRFDDIPLALGANLLRVRALDGACNEGFAELTVTRVSTADCLFADDLEGWQVDIAPPLANRLPATVTAANCIATLTEGDSFVATLGGTFTVPATPSVLEVQFLGPTFDPASTHAINDAFEIAVVDDAGNPLTYVIAEGRDACFNLTEGQANAATAQGVVFTRSPSGTEPSTISISLAHLFPGQSFHLICRLVNNDGDPGSTVRLVNVQLAAEPHSGILLASDEPQAGRARLLPSRPVWIGSGEHTRPRVSRPAPSPVGLVLPDLSGRADMVTRTRVAGEAPATAPGAGALPLQIGLTAAHNRRAIALASDPSPSSGSAFISLTVNLQPADVPAGNTILLTGEAHTGQPSSVPLAAVTLNGRGVDAFDQAGQFFARVTIAPGQNTFMFTATAATGEAASATLMIFGSDPAEAGPNLATLSDVSSSLTAEWGRTSFNEEAKTLFADLSIRNTGQYPVKTPLVIGIARLSDPSVRLLNADGLTPDGIPYFDLTSLVPNSSFDILNSTFPKTLAFANPRRTQFTFELVVLGLLNRAPAFTTVPVIQAIVGQPYTYAFEAVDPDDDPLTYSLASNPSGLTLNPQPRTLNWLPAQGDLGTHNIRLRTEDGHGGSAEQAYVLSVIQPPPNRPPYFTSTPVVFALPSTEHTPSTFSPFPAGQLFIASSTYSHEVRAYDADTLQFIRAFTHPLFHTGTTSWDPRGMVFNGRGNLVCAANTHLVEFSDYGVEFQRYPKRTVEASENVLLDQLGNLYTTTWTYGSDQLHQYRASDYTFLQTISLPSGAGALTGITFDDQRRLYVASQADSKVHVLQADPSFRTFTQVRSFVVSRSVEGIQFNFNGELVVAGGNGGDLSRFDPLTGRVLGTFDAPFDFWPVPLSVDGIGRIYTADFENGIGTLSADLIRFSPDGVSFVATNDAQLYGPFGIAISGVTLPGAPRLFPYTYDSDAVDPDNDRLAYALLDAPINMVLEPTSGAIGWSPGLNQIGDHRVIVHVSDGRGGTATQAYVVRVLPDPVNHPPVIVSEPMTGAVVDQVYAYDVEALDPDNDLLKYALVGPPTGMTIDASTGLISWQVASDAAGTHALTVRVEDGRGASDQQQFTINVTATPILPDLIIGKVNRDGLTMDPQALAAVGIVTATVTNQGPGTVSGPFDVLFFEDVNHNGAYDPNADTTLATTEVSGPLGNGAAAEVTAQVAGVVTFPGAFVWAFADSGDTISEANEANNLARNTVACQFVPPVGQFNPVVERHVVTFSTWPESKQVMMSPAVADMNQDGVPDIVAATYRTYSGYNIADVPVLRVLDGATGTEIWSVGDDSRKMRAVAGLAVGDIDGDSLPDVVAIHDSGAVIALGNDGSPKWTSTRVFGGAINWACPTLADLDGDGTPEIIIGSTTLNSDGTVRWEGSASGGLGSGDNGFGPISLVADLDLDGHPEVVAGRSVHRHDGSLGWNATVGDGFPGVGNFDDDLYPEIVLVTSGKVYLLEHTGEVRWGPVSIPGGGRGGAPTIADMDGDGLPEIGVAGASRYVVFEHDGTEKWESPTQDRTSNATGSSVFDFDGDGRAEVVYADELFLRIYRGSDGTILYQMPKTSCTTYEYPVIADVDGDGNAEIVAVANDSCLELTGASATQSGLYIIGDANDTWVPTRQIWNQHTYHINNVNDDGTIPAHEEPSWLTHNTYRLNAQPAGLSPHSAPDLMSCFVRLTEASGQTTITARIGNGGEILVGPGIKVAFYNGDPKSGGVRLGVASTTGRIEPGAFEDVSRTISRSAPADLWVVADDDGTGKGQVNECNEVNNVHHLADANAKGLIAGTVFNDQDGDGNWSRGGSIYLDSVQVSVTGARTTDIVRTWLDGSCPETIVEHSTPTHQSSASVAFDVNEMLMFSDEGGWLFRANLDGTGRVNLARADGPEIEVDPVHRKVYWCIAWSGSGLPRGVYWANYDGSEAARIIESRYPLTGIAVDPVRGKIYFGDGVNQIIRANLDGSSPERFYVEPGPVNPQIYDVEIDVEAGIVYWNEYWGANISKQRFQAKKVEADVPAWTVFHPPTGLSNGFHFNALDQHIYYFDIVGDVCRVRADGTGYEWLFGKSFGSYYLEILYLEGTATSDGLLAGWRVWLDLDGDRQWDTGERFLLTDGCGRYEFTHLPSGDYTIVAESRAGWRHTTPLSSVVTLTVGAGFDAATADFGLAQEAPPLNRPPVFTSTPPTTATVGELWRYQAVATDPDEDEVQFAFTPSGSATGMKSGGQPGLAVWVPRSDQVGVNQFIAIAQDARGASTLHPFEVTVLPPNWAPVIASHPRGPAYVGLSWQYQAAAQDPDNDAITFRLADHPDGMTIDPVNGLVSWTPQATQTPSQHVTVAAADGRGGEATQSFDLPVVEPVQNQPPTITSTPRASVRLGTTFLYQVEASDPDNEPLTFSLASVPAGMAFAAEQPADPNQGLITWTPTAAQVGPHTVDVQVQDSRGLGVVQRFTVTVTVQASNHSPSIVSQPPQAATMGELYQYDAVATDPDADLLLWSLETFPTGMSVDPQAGTIRWTPALDQLGLQNVRIHVADSQGGSARQTYQVAVRAVNLPPSITSAPLTTAAPDELYSYVVQASDPDGDALAFSLSTKPEGMTVDSESGLVEWTPTSAQLGTVSVVIRVEDGRSGVVEQSYEVVVSAQAPNQAPVITSDPPFLAVVNAPYNYSVTATDPDGDTLTFRLLAFPPGMTINASSGLVQWAPGGEHLGSHTVTVAAVDPDGAGGTQTFSVTVAPVNGQPMITSQPVQQVPAGTPYRYDVRASDPDGDLLAYTLSGPAGMAIDQVGRVTWLPQVADAGIHRVAITVTDPLGLDRTQEYELRVTADTTPPFVRLGRGADRLPVGTILDITAVATDNSGQVTLVLTIGGVPVPLNAQGYAAVELKAAGVFEVLAVATDPAGNVAQDSYPLTVEEAVNDPEAPVVEITAPAADALVTAPTPIVGTASDANLTFYKLEVGLLSGGPLTEIGRGTASVVNGVLGRLDPTTLANDSYRLVLTAQDAGGNIVSTETTFEVTGELKIGNFTLSFVDLSIPVTGIPITIGRTYDSLNAGQRGEFGYGWRLEFREANLRNNLPARQDWEVEFGFYPAFTDRTRVYVTVPGGRRQGFTFKPTLIPGFASMFGFYKPAFQPDAGVTSQLTVPAGPNVVLRYDNSSGTYQAVDSNGGTTAYNPEDPVFGGVYTLTTKEGVAYRIDAATRLVTQVFDATGNTLTFTDAAVISSAGPRVDFTRDPQGRITAVKDPAGKSILYQYDSQGDLVAVTDREGNTTQFKYENPRPHYLTEVVDPLGRSGVRTEYDEQGRLVKLRDAAGNPVELVHDLDNSMEKVVDALGRTTTFVYDARGNVLQEINALGGETRREYDLANNMTLEKDALGNITRFTYDADANVLTRTDPLGNVTLNTYTRIYPRGWFNFTGRTLVLLQTSTDPLGNTTRNEYDGAGNVSATTDALGNVTRYVHDRYGNQVQMTDAFGKETAFEYDPVGRLTKQADALGNVTTFTYDANGNQLTQTSTLTTSTGQKSLVTSTTYDANGRPTSVTDAAGNVTRTEYDALGKTKATIDALNHRTGFEYDERGQLVRTVFTDDTFSQLAYDDAGRRTSSTDRAGRTTDYEYDALGRLVKTTYPGGTGDLGGTGDPPVGGGDPPPPPSTSTTYDLAGRVIAQTDELGHTTVFGYDAAGRQTSITNALGAVARSEYDTAGRKTADLDALGRKTQFEYDALGRRVKTTFADNTTKQTAYDSLGRVTAETDQAGVKTQFEYDALGRLTAVVDALNSRTGYAYNEQGQLVRQQDANGHVTRYEYETCCQRSATVLPLGQRSTTQYNQVNNVASVTDFNGRTISCDYDLNNRLKTKSFPDGTAVQFAYTATGRRQTITDPRGVTTFEYDDRDRLLKRTDPDGRFVAYTYDAASKRTSVSTATGTTLYAFDELNRLASVTDTEGGITRYIYNEANNVVRMELPNGTVRVNTYDPLNRVNDIQHVGPAGIFASFRYSLGPTGNRVEVVEHDGRRVNYSYDALYRLVQESITDPVAGNRTIGYTMDPVGNRLTRDDSGEGITTYTYDANDQLLTETLAGSTTSYGYDANGNTLSRSNANETTEYDWDAENRLVGFRRFAASHSPLATGHYQYDTDGIRVSKTATEAGNTQTTSYLIDANRPYAHVLEEWQSLNAQPSSLNASYTYGPHHPISQLRAGVRSYYHADHLGTTRVLTDRNVNSTTGYVFDAYGRTISRAGSTQNVYLFGGEHRDHELRLDYLRARYLSVDTGRFISRDPADGSLWEPSTRGVYMYASASPTINVDPTGRFYVQALATLALLAICDTSLAEATAPHLTVAELVGKKVETITRDQVLPDAGSVAVRMAADNPNYATWFGAETSDRIAFVRAAWVQIADVSRTVSIKYEHSLESGKIAQADPTKNTIYLGHRFIRILYGGDNQATPVGVLIHELAHFVRLGESPLESLFHLKDVTGYGCTPYGRDFEGSNQTCYGKENASHLAAFKPQFAIKNPDNYRLQAENSP